ncbi:hypothetical protein OSB04_021100 [Centaurea solstitialis]|uniref:Uncharacterized protein n=1 Tax=Centaurea solstitialis TaxID=347529 RepID=A0AA38W4K8_9ASTR|nr:hypothetical protein OSB04_021100 [Centaurea solstitialis]
MEKQANQETIILQPCSCWTILGVLLQIRTIKMIFENGEQLGLLILVLLLTMSQFEVAFNCLLEEFSFRLSHHRSHPGDNIRELIAVKLLVLICSCCIVLFFSVAAVFSSASGVKAISLKDIVSKSKTSWKRPFITSCYLSLVVAPYNIVAGKTRFIFQLGASSKQNDNQETHFMNFRQPLSMVGVLKETMKTILTNKRAMTLILCLLIVTNLQIEMATRYHSLPNQEPFSIRISNHKRDIYMPQHRHVTNFREQLLTKFHILVCSCFLFFYSAITTISLSYESYTGNKLTVVKVFLKASRNWKRPLVTSGCILLLTLGINLVYLFSIALVSILAGGSNMAVIRVTLKWILDGHVAVLSVMSIVVSVIEDGMSGIKAIGRAGELMKGKGVQGVMVMMVCFIAHFLAKKSSVAFSTMFEEWAIWAIHIPSVIGFTCLLEVIVFVFFTVLYHECKMNRKQDKYS